MLILLIMGRLASPIMACKVLTLWKLLYIYDLGHISLRYHDQPNLYVLLDFWNRIKYENLLSCIITYSRKTRGKWFKAPD